MLGLFRKKEESPSPKTIPYPEDLPQVMREYAKQNIDLNNWIAGFQSDKGFHDIEEKHRQQIYRMVYDAFKEWDGDKEVKFSFSLAQNQAEKLRAYLDKNKMTIEEFVLQSLEKHEQP